MLYSFGISIFAILLNQVSAPMELILHRSLSPKKTPGRSLNEIGTRQAKSWWHKFKMYSKGSLPFRKIRSQRLDIGRGYFGDILIFVNKLTGLYSVAAFTLGRPEISLTEIKLQACKTLSWKTAKLYRSIPRSTSFSSSRMHKSLPRPVLS